MNKLEYSKEDIIEIQNDIDKLQQENEQLKERINKAIKYMEESMNNPLKYEWGVLKHTLEILKGE